MTYFIIYLHIDFFLFPAGIKPACGNSRVIGALHVAGQGIAHQDAAFPCTLRQTEKVRPASLTLQHLNHSLYR